ncbi:GIY-YIG nuclease family protein, partial [Patescibacteria group bacterium]|nr:GIY-YIG nuclease family protein [Patescibacteria group bacterium]
MQNQSKTKKYSVNRKDARKLPEAAGVYIFINRDGEPIYVGKAKNLRARVRSYFSTNLSTKTKEMINEAKTFTTILVGSELEAILLEARLVRKYQTKYNSALKDDKHPIYIRITDETYPRVLTARKVDENPLDGGKNSAFLGPFPSTSNVRSVLRLLRRIFPYAQHKLGKRACLYSQMGLCNPCPN